MTIDEQIKYCTDQRIEWADSVNELGELGMIARKKVAVFQALEDSLTQAKKLMDAVEVQYRIIHGEPEVKEDAKAKSPEQRIKEKQKK